MITVTMVLALPLEEASRSYLLDLAGAYQINSSIRRIQVRGKRIYHQVEMHGFADQIRKASVWFGDHGIECLSIESKVGDFDESDKTV